MGPSAPAAKLHCYNDNAASVSRLALDASVGEPTGNGDTTLYGFIDIGDDLVDAHVLESGSDSSGCDDGAVGDGVADAGGGEAGGATPRPSLGTAPLDNGVVATAMVRRLSSKGSFLGRALVPSASPRCSPTPPLQTSTSLGNYPRHPEKVSRGRVGAGGMRSRVGA